MDELEVIGKEMSTPVEIVTKIEDGRISNMFVMDEHGISVDSLKQGDSFRIDVTDGKCILYRAENKLIYAKDYCDLIRLDAWVRETSWN